MHRKDKKKALKTIIMTKLKNFAKIKKIEENF